MNDTTPPPEQDITEGDIIGPQPIRLATGGLQCGYTGCFRDFIAWNAYAWHVIDDHHHLAPPKPADYDPTTAIDNAIAEFYDPTHNPDIHQLPAQTTSMTPAQFNAWVAAEGEIFMVMLPAGASFIVKVPDAQNTFFVSLMQQFRFTLGPEVQAVRMQAVKAPGADVEGDGTAAQAPEWAQPDAPDDGHLERHDIAQRMDTKTGEFIACTCGCYAGRAVCDTYDALAKEPRGHA